MATTKKVVLSAPQYELVTTEKRFPAFVGGFGSGKTQALISRCLRLKLAYPKLSVAYYLPTFDLVKKIAYPRFAEQLEEWGLKYVTNKTDATITIVGYGQIIFRTMDTPERIVGYEVADSFVDELDTLSEEDAKSIWSRVLSRNRQKKLDGKPNTIAVGTTPEGFRFVYARWKKSPPNEDYHLIRASTYSNKHNLPSGYIDDLKNDYPAQLIEAYINGEFVNLTSGTVYGSFCRKKNFSNEAIRPNEAVHVGMDFNVGKMAAVVFVSRGGKWHAVCEHTGVLDTPAMIALLKSVYKGHKIFVYPDAAGRQRKSTDASKSDISLLYSAGFLVMANPSNPAVKDRVLALNLAFDKEYVYVNPDTCPELTEALEKQAYDKKGNPDKEGGHDHINDACGYGVVYKFPVRSRSVKRIKIGGV